MKTSSDASQWPGSRVRMTSRTLCCFSPMLRDPGSSTGIPSPSMVVGPQTGHGKLSASAIGKPIAHPAVFLQLNTCPGPVLRERGGSSSSSSGSGRILKGFWHVAQAFDSKRRRPALGWPFFYVRSLPFRRTAPALPSLQEVLERLFNSVHQVLLLRSSTSVRPSERRGGEPYRPEPEHRCPSERGSRARELPRG